MDDIVPLRDIGKAFDRTGILLFLLLLRSLFSFSRFVYAEDIAVRDVAEHIIAQYHSLRQFALLYPDPSVKAGPRQELFHVLKTFI